MEKLIFDRTNIDVLNKTPKGFYNLSDVNRILEYIRYIRDYIGRTEEFPVTFAFGDYITIQDMLLILREIEEIINQWYIADGMPDVPTVRHNDNWDYNKANDIEKILNSLYEFILSDQKDHYYMGTFRSGQLIKFVQWIKNEHERFYDKNLEEFKTLTDEFFVVK